MPEKIPDKRKAIIEAAGEIFVRQGYEATTIAEIATAAQVAVGTVYLYFHNKREIYFCTSLDMLYEMADAISQPEIFALPVKLVPRVMIEKVFQICHQSKRLTALFQVDIQTPEELELYRQAEQRITDAISFYLSQCIARGDFPPFDTEMYAKIFNNLVHGMTYQCYCLENGSNEEHYKKSTIEVIERIFFGPSLHG
jgi:AcrR family transcriptional regulator